MQILSLNIYLMGHVTYQNALESAFSKYLPQARFNSLHLTDVLKKDFNGRVMSWFLRRRLPFMGDKDYDLIRFRSELAVSYFARRYLAKNIKLLNPDVIHVHTQSIALLAGSIFRRRPAVVSLDYTSALLAREHPMPAKYTYRPTMAMERRCFKAAAHVITWSDRARMSVINDYSIPEDKVTTIHPMLPLEYFNKMERRIPDTPRKTRLLFVGNDFERKGGPDVLAVFLEKFSETCHLDLVTNTPQTISAHPAVTLHRNMKPLSAELLKLYQDADIFVMPTREDVYALVFREAAAAGLPCIATNVMAVPEIVRDGINGITIKPRDRESLAQALKTLIDNPELRLQMGMAGREMAQASCDAEKNCKRIMSVFEKARARCVPGLSGAASPQLS